MRPTTIFQKIYDEAFKVVQISSEFAYQIKRLQYNKKLPVLPPSDQHIVDCCKQNGVCLTSLEKLAIPNTSELIAATATQLAIMEKLLPRSRVALEARDSAGNSLYPQIFTVTDLPEFFNWGNHPRLLQIVESYIGLPVTFQGVHLRRDFANDTPITTELWHRDLEDRHMMKIIVYLCDVEEVNGPFEYIPKFLVSPFLAHRIQTKIARAHALGINDQEMATLVPKSAWKACPGKSNTTVFVDPVSVFHHGKSRQVERAALFFVYTTANPLHPEDCAQYRDQTFARPVHS